MNHSKEQNCIVEAPYEGMRIDDFIRRMQYILSIFEDDIMLQSINAESSDVVFTKTWLLYQIETAKTMQRQEFMAILKLPQSGNYIWHSSSEVYPVTKEPNGEYHFKWQE